MLSKDLRYFGKILIPLSLAAWGLFALLFSTHLDDIPRPIWWLGAVFTLAVGLAGIVGLWFRAKNRNGPR